MTNVRNLESRHFVAFVKSVFHIMYVAKDPNRL